MSFRDIRGQDKAVLFLKKAVEKSRVSQAYIFLGASGIGKKLTAINFAKALNCEAHAPERPCDKCPSCKKIDSLNHPDVFLVKPQKASSAIGIDDVRGIIKDIALKPFQGRKKVYIIDEASSMRHEAANALLKTLEEPSPDSVLILIVDRLKLILPTITSRAQVVRFFPLKADELKGILMDEYSLDDPKAHVVSHISSGRLGEAIRYGRDEDFFKKRLAILKGLSNNDYMDFEETSKEKLKTYLDIMLSWYRDILLAKVGAGREAGFINVDLEPDILAASSRLDAGYLEEMIKEVIATAYFLDQNANSKLAMAALGSKAYLNERGRSCTK